MLKPFSLPFETKPKRQLILFIGIQASGKTTFYKTTLANRGYVHINLDTLRTRYREQMAISDCLQSSDSFVVDNTNPQRADRMRYIPDAKAHGSEIIGIFFQSIVKECILRNEQRDRQVPRNAIPCTQNKLELPEYAEGFDKLYFARITENGFEITDWKE